jgi:hypothetical protein
MIGGRYVALSLAAASFVAGYEGSFDNVVRGASLYLCFNLKECSYFRPLLSKTGTNLTTRVANGGFACPELEF